MSADVLAAMASGRAARPEHPQQPTLAVRARPRDRFEVFADYTRATPAIDPLGRWVHLACGAAALNAAVDGQARSGVGVRSRLLPDRERPDLMAVIDAGWHEVIAEHSAEDVALAAAFPQRHTVRTRFRPTPVPPALVDRLRAAVEREGAWLHVVRDREDVVELTVLTERAEAAEAADERYREELRAWMRSTRALAEDGIPRRCLPADGSLRSRLARAAAGLPR